MEVVALLRWFSLYIKHVTPLPKGQFPKMYFAPSLPQSSDALWTDRGVDYRQTFGFLITWCSTNAFCWAVSTKSTVMGGQFGYMRSIISWPKLGADTSHVRQLVGFSLYMIFWFQRDLEEFETICLESFVIQNNHDFLWWFPAWGVPREMTIVSYHWTGGTLFHQAIPWWDRLTRPTIEPGIGIWADSWWYLSSYGSCFQWPWMWNSGAAQQKPCFCFF